MGYGTGLKSFLDELSGLQRAENEPNPTHPKEMKLNSKTLPVNLLAKMDKSERKTLGKPGKLPHEIDASNGAKIEKELQQQIAAHLRRNGVPFFQQRTDKRSRGTVGWCDFTIPVNGKTIYIECKTWNGKLRPEQVEMARAFLVQGYSIHVIRSYEHYLILYRQYATGTNK